MAVMNEIGYRFPRIVSEKKQEINNGSFFIIVVDHQAMQNAEDSRGKENKFSFVDDNLCCPGTLTHRNKTSRQGTSQSGVRERSGLRTF